MRNFISQRVNAIPPSGIRRFFDIAAANPEVIEARRLVTVVPITHTSPDDPSDGVQIPAALKAHLGPDQASAWIVVIETNDFLWPGPDIRPGQTYGMLPPRFFAHLRDCILQAHVRRKLAQVRRTE